MLIGMRNTMLGAGWKNPYITNGLVAMWDGEWNAGGGKHDANATTWKDLTGNGWDFPAENLSFHDNYVEALANVSSLKSSAELWDWNAASYEAVCERPSTNSVSNGFFNLGRCGIVNVNNGFVNGYLWFTGSATDNWRCLYLSGYNKFDLAHRGFVTDFSSSYTHQKVYRNGIYVPSSYYSDESWMTTISHTARQMVLHRGTVGYPKYWSIRLYSRALAADEIAYNYAVDKARFNLP